MPWRWLTIAACCLSILGAIAEAQQFALTPPAEPPITPTAPNETELAKAERESAARVVELRKSQDAESEQRQQVADLQQILEKARESGDEQAIAGAESELRAAQESLERLSENTATALKLHTQAKDKLEIAKKNVELSSKKAEPGVLDTAKIPFDDVLKKKTRVDQANQEAQLAQKKTQTLRAQLNTLLDRQRELRRGQDELFQKLNSSEGLSPKDKTRILAERQEMVEAGRRVGDEIQQVRDEILLAEASQRIKEEAAAEERASYASWQRNLIGAGILFAVALLLVLGARFVVARRVVEPQRRYYLNKILSLIMTLILVIGVVFIFADQFSSMLTLFGLAVAGVTIALQEIVASFAAWFFIRSSRGYSTGEWIQIGDQFGEVVDITFLRTTIQQFEPLTGEGRPHGATPTGGLTVMMNNMVFKSPLVNFTRGYPFIWCSLTYTFTFESDWEQARQLMLDAMLQEPEIVSTAKQAARHIQDMASNYSIRVDSTQPTVRAWVGSPGVELTLRFLAHPRRRPLLTDTVNTNIMRAVKKAANIDYAYWTVRSISTPPTSPVLSTVRGPGDALGPDRNQRDDPYRRTDDDRERSLRSA